MIVENKRKIERLQNKLDVIQANRQKNKLRIEQIFPTFLAQILQINTAEKKLFDELLSKFSSLLGVFSKLQKLIKDRPCTQDKKLVNPATKANEEIEALKKENEKLKAQSTQFEIVTQENKLLMGKINELRKQNATPKASTGGKDKQGQDFIEQLAKKTAEIENLTKELATAQGKTLELTESKKGKIFK